MLVGNRPGTWKAVFDKFDPLRADRVARIYPQPPLCW